MDAAGDDLSGKLDAALRALQPLMEERRKKFMRGVIVSAIMLGLIAGTLVFYHRNSLDYPLLLIVFAGLIPAMIWYQILSHFYRRGAKAVFLEQLMQQTGLVFKPEGIFSLKDAEKHFILPPFHQGYTEDGFEGNHHGVSFALQEIALADLEPEPRSRRRPGQPVRRQPVPVFEGFLLRITLRRGLSGHTLIVPSNAAQTWFRTRLSKFSPVRLVSPVFEKLYDVMSTDQVESRVILNPAFMERLIEAGKTLKVRWMDVSFFGNEIMIAAQRSGGLFEAGPLWQTVTEERLAISIAPLQTAHQLIDVLRRNRQIAL